MNNKEVIAINKAIYNSRPLSEITKSEYIRATQTLLDEDCSENIPVTKINIEIALNQNLDIEAIEYFIRLTKGNNDLSQRFHIFLYITESQKEYYSIFINEKSEPILGLILMFSSVFQSIYKFIKGFLLTKRYKLLKQSHDQTK